MLGRLGSEVFSPKCPRHSILHVYLVGSFLSRLTSASPCRLLASILFRICILPFVVQLSWCLGFAFCLCNLTPLLLLALSLHSCIPCLTSLSVSISLRSRKPSLISCSHFFLLSSSFLPSFLLLPWFLASSFCYRCLSLLSVSFDF
jgi:hypothetical protein